MEQQVILTFIWLLGIHVSTSNSQTVPRLCDADFSTPETCYILVDRSMEYWEADKYCNNTYPGPGDLAIIGDQPTQDFLASEVQKKGWPRTWISGLVDNRRWKWLESSTPEYLAYQGCWIDDPLDRDLTQQVTNIAGPSDCIVACKTRGLMYAGVQMLGSQFLCHCGNSFGKHGRSYNPGCDKNCPLATNQSEVINQVCGGLNLQLIYMVDGSTFEYFAPISLRSYEPCVVYNHQLSHQWTEMSCQVKNGYICNEGFQDLTTCEVYNGHIWTAGICISVHNELKNFYEAFYTCKQRYFLMAKVLSPEVNAAILKHLNSDVSYYFLLTGQTIIFSKWKFHTSYTNFASNQPSKDRDNDCFVMSSADNWKWATVNCSLKLPFTCMISTITTDISATSIATTSTLPPTSTVTQGTINTAITSTPTLTSTSTSSVPQGPTRQPVNIFVWVGVGVGGSIVLITVIITNFCLLRKRKLRVEKQQKGHGRNTNTNTQVSPNNYESNRRTPGPGDRNERGHQAQSGHFPLDGQGQVHGNQARYLATSSPSDPEHRYERLRNGNDHIYQDPDYEHYVEIAS